jgi:hypothetical protein
VVVAQASQIHFDSFEKDLSPNAGKTMVAGY